MAKFRSILRLNEPCQKEFWNVDGKVVCILRVVNLHWPGIEPGSVPWQGTILPLDHQYPIMFFSKNSNYIYRNNRTTNNRRSKKDERNTENEWMNEFVAIETLGKAQRDETQFEGDLVPKQIRTACLHKEHLSHPSMTSSIFILLRVHRKCSTAIPIRKL